MAFRREVLICDAQGDALWTMNLQQPGRVLAVRSVEPDWIAVITPQSALRRFLARVLCGATAIALVACLLLCGCDRPAPASDWRAAAAWDWALALDRPTSAPTPAPVPDDGQAGQLPQGFFGDAKELIAKGHALADRAKTILDQAEREGKVTVDVRLPGRLPAATPPATPPEKLSDLDRRFLTKNHWRLSAGTCGMLGCTQHGGGWIQEEGEAEGETTYCGSGCAGGVCRPGLLRLFRRR